MSKKTLCMQLEVVALSVVLIDQSGCCNIADILHRSSSIGSAQPSPRHPTTLKTIILIFYSCPNSLCILLNFFFQNRSSNMLSCTTLLVLPLLCSHAVAHTFIWVLQAPVPPHSQVFQLSLPGCLREWRRSRPLQRYPHATLQCRS